MILLHVRVEPEAFWVVLVKHVALDQILLGVGLAVGSVLIALGLELIVHVIFVRVVFAGLVAEAQGATSQLAVIQHANVEHPCSGLPEVLGVIVLAVAAFVEAG